jgi:predicted glycoside hydrolase/deacetylase ChbG (UPF0249 family)
MKTSRFLIVNADDFGMSPGVNRGVIEAHQRGIVTSTSLMVRWPDAADAASSALAEPDLAVGLHVDLGEWIWREGSRDTLYLVADPEDAGAVAREVQGQLAIFRSLMGRDPTHLDSHQHVHRREPVRTILSDLAAELDVPLREFDPAITLCGEFYGQTGFGEPAHDLITVEHLLSILQGLPKGITELMCHAGHGEGLATIYDTERDQELAVLCDPRIREALDSLHITLTSFAEVRSGR